MCANAVSPPITQSLASSYLHSAWIRYLLHTYILLT